MVQSLLVYPPNPQKSSKDLKLLGAQGRRIDHTLSKLLGECSPGQDRYYGSLKLAEAERARRASILGFPTSTRRHHEKREASAQQVFFDHYE